MPAKRRIANRNHTVQFDETEMHEIAIMRLQFGNPMWLPRCEMGGGALAQRRPQVLGLHPELTKCTCPKPRDTALGPTDERLGIVHLDWHRFALEAA